MKLEILNRFGAIGNEFELFSIKTGQIAVSAYHPLAKFVQIVICSIYFTFREKHWYEKHKEVLEKK